MKLEDKKIITNKRRKEIMNINKKKVTTKSPVAIINNQPIIKEYEMKVKQLQLSFLFMLLLTTLTFGQNEDLKIFGFFQNNVNYYTLSNNNPKVKFPEKKYTSFVFQQMNVFLTKNFGTEFSSFVNLEFTNSFSSTDNVGTFRVEEAWLKYSPSNEFAFKAGLLIPRFDNFNEIKNRTALLPYIFRPLIYETSFAGQFNSDDYMPMQAFFQVDGKVDLGNIELNYAAFAGNSDRKNLIKNDASSGFANDSAKFKLFGGRLGVKYDNLELGVSSSYDKKNYWSLGIGQVPRIRFGAYLNYSAYNFELEGEYIKVNFPLSERNKNILAAKRASATPAPGLAQPPSPLEFDNTFYYGNLLYNFTDKYYGYVGYNYIETTDSRMSYQGTKGISAGAGYRVSDAITLKAQYFKLDYGFAQLTRNTYLLGASVLF